jgi:hypothetical protein
LVVTVDFCEGEVVQLLAVQAQVMDKEKPADHAVTFGSV